MFSCDLTASKSPSSIVFRNVVIVIVDIVVIANSLTLFVLLDYI